MGLVYHKAMSNIDHVKSVMVSVDKELWREAKHLAVKRERPVRLIVADGLRLLLEQDRVQGDPVDFCDVLVQETYTK